MQSMAAHRGPISERPAAVRAPLVAAWIVLAGIMLGASYMLGMFQRLVLGPVSAQSATLHDLNRREMACVIPLVLAVFVIGLYPSSMLDLMDASVTTLVQDFAQVQPLQIAEALTAP